MNYNKTAIRLIVLAAVLVAVGTLAYARDPAADVRDRAHARAVNAKVDQLTGGTPPEALRVLRSEIAAMRPSGTTLLTLARRYKSGDAFLRNQLDSIIGQADFSGSENEAALIAASTKEFDLFVAVTFGLGNSSSPMARQAALDLMENNQFKADPARVEAAADTVRWILRDTIVSSDFAWLATAVEQGELSPRQLDVALAAADRLRSTEAIAFLRHAASFATSDEERMRLERRLDVLKSTTRPER